MLRRSVLAGLAGALPAARGWAASAGAADYAVVQPGVPLRFPADHGAHPAFRTEWWYLTGWLEGAGASPTGFQITFFRTRTAANPRNPSRFSPRQILFAHAALSDPAVGRLLHDQRAARAGFGLAEAAVGEADILIDDWRLRRLPDGRFLARAGGKAFGLDLSFRPTQPVLAQGEAGFSRKGPKPAQASYYYSLPHLAVAGSIRHRGRTGPVTGIAWMDREWSSTLLDPRAVGWDWTGLNLDDGGSIMAFQVRDARGQALWAGGSMRAVDGAVATFGPDEVSFAVERRWRSPRTGAVYPVQQTLTIRRPAGAPVRLRLKPLFDDQELDSRPGGGPVYWEGAVRAGGARGYLELTGYARPLAL